MRKVELKTNDDQHESETFIVSEEVYKRVEELQYSGGFLRFHINQFWEVSKSITEFEGLAKWLNENVFFIDDDNASLLDFLKTKR